MSKNRKLKIESKESTVVKEEMKMYRVPVYRVSLVKDSYQSSSSKSISKPQDIYEIARNYLADADREHFVVMMISTNNQVIGINTVAIGNLNRCLVHPREVFKPAIIANSASVILLHNHPSGDPKPSREDLEVTKRLKCAGEILGISVLDHIILGDEGYVSLREREELWG